MPLETFPAILTNAYIQQQKGVLADLQRQEPSVVIEHMTAIARPVVDRELLGFGKPIGLDLFEVGREHECLEGAAAEIGRAHV